MKQVEPVCKRISSLTEVSQDNIDKQDKDGDKVTIKANVCDISLRFTPLPFRHFPAGASPSQITKLSMDKSQVLEEIMAKSTGLLSCEILKILAMKEYENVLC